MLLPTLRHQGNHACTEHTYVEVSRHLVVNVLLEGYEAAFKGGQRIHRAKGDAAFAAFAATSKNREERSIHLVFCLLFGPARTYLNSRDRCGSSPPVPLCLCPSTFFTYKCRAMFDDFDPKAKYFHMFDRRQHCMRCRRANSLSNRAEKVFDEVKVTEMVPRCGLNSIR